MALKIGIIGHGFMGHEHEKMLTSMDEIEVTAICDIDPSVLDDVKEGITVYHTPEELVADPNVETVLIAANNNQHKKLVIMAAEAGKDIICEKPIALSLSELDEMEEAVKKAGVHFTVHHQRRLDRDYRTAKAVFDSGVLGDPFVVKTMLYGYNGNMHDWHVIPEEGGGMLYDWGVHLIDQMLWMIPGKVSTVYANVRNVINEKVDDYFHIMMRFESGIVAEIELGTYYLTDREHWFERHWFLGGNKGSAYVDGFEPEGKIATTEHLLENVGTKRTMTAAGPTRSFGPPPEGLILTEDLEIAETKHEDYFKNYVRAMEGKEDFLVKIDETRRVLRLMDAIRESARTGKSVDFE